MNVTGISDPKPAEDRHRRWRKLLALALVVAALGLPLNDLPRYAMLVIAAVLIGVGAVSRDPKRWLGAIAALAICLLAHTVVSPPRIEEGHNVFLVDQPGGALEASLPQEAFRLMLVAFDARYPVDRRCDPNNSDCWRAQGFPDRPFAFSADGIFDRPAYSRRVTGIEFSDPVWLRLGFINELRYNWNAQVSDIDRASRDRRFWAFVHKWRLEMPWFVMYRFPAGFAGNALCWRGDVLWERAGERFEAIRHPAMACRTLAAEDVGRRIFGVAIATEPPLAMRLDPTFMIRLRQLADAAVPLVAAALIVGLLVTWRRRQAALPFTFVALALVVAFFNDASFIGGVRPFDGGDDGLVFDGFARRMLQHLLAGDIGGVLRGEEDVFFFTPGTRYLLALNHLLFGESYLGYLSLMLGLPFLVLTMFHRFLPWSWALPLALIFTAIPLGVLFGSSLVLYVKWAARGFGDPAGYMFFLAGFLLLVGRSKAGPDDRWLPALGAGFLFALALFVRPNIAPAAGVLLTGAGLAALWQAQYRRVAGLCIGFAPVLGMALHNWVYGGVLVLFTSTVALVYQMPPSAYLSAIAELARFDFAGEHLARAISQLGDWLAGPSELGLTAPLNAAAIVVLVRVVFWRRADPWLRLTAGAALTQHGVSLLLYSLSRYHYLTWLLTLLVVVVWFRDEGLDWMLQRFPAVTGRIASHPATRALKDFLDRLASRFDDTASGRSPV